MLAYDTTSNYRNKAETRTTRQNVSELTEPTWSFDAGSMVAATPLIVGDRVFVVGSGDITHPEQPCLFALEAATGAEVWSVAGVCASATPAYEGGVLYVHDSSGTVRALAASNGKEIWNYETDDHPNVIGYSSPVLTSDHVIVGGSSAEELVAKVSATFRGFVLALHKDGTLAWKKYTVDPPDSGAAVWSTVSVDPHAGRVFATTGNNYTGNATETSDAFLGLPLADGDADFFFVTQVLAGDVWVQRNPGGGPEFDFGANPILYEVQGRRLAAAGAKSGTAYVIDRDTGEMLSERNLGPGTAHHGGILNNGAYDGERLLMACNGATSDAPDSEASTTPSVLYALDPVTLDIEWERQLGDKVFGPITVANGVGFVARGTKLQAFDTESGQKVFEWDSEATIATGAAVSNGLIVFGSGMSWIGTRTGTMVHAFRVE